MDQKEEIPTMTFFYKGQCDGQSMYSWISDDGKETNPWMSYSTALATAKVNNCKAKFIREQP